MVRFIIPVDAPPVASAARFTFQYGQIYYRRAKHGRKSNRSIYIPIWLDLLYDYSLICLGVLNNLHSNMVRFIMIYIICQVRLYISFTFQYGQIYYFCILELFIPVFLIYIPIWLDLLLDKLLLDLVCLFDLHSNMVRFIIESILNQLEEPGSIYIPIWLDLLFLLLVLSLLNLQIYIPIWLDLLYLLLIDLRLSMSHLHSNMVRFIIASSCCLQ